MAQRYITTVDGLRIILDPRSTKAWTQLAKRVIAEEPPRWLRLLGRTGLSTTGEHVIPVSERPDLALVRSNTRGACRAVRVVANKIQPQATSGGWQALPSSLSAEFGVTLRLGDSRAGILRDRGVSPCRVREACVVKALGHRITSERHQRHAKAYTQGAGT